MGCKACGSPVSGQGRHYCSPDCALVTRECSWCHKVEQVPRKRQSRPFCSQRCAKAHGGADRRVPKVQIVCEWCGSTFERVPSHATTRKKFCSRNCAGLGRPLNGKPSKIATEAIATWAARSDMPHECEMRVGRWSIDLAFPDYLLAIELDGVYWHSLPAMVEKDARKDAYLRSRGWTVVRIPIEKNATAQGVAAAIGAAVTRSLPWTHLATT